ncbi:MAG: hypothetical protein HFE68_05895 [Erysipelotrichaceae bacterium]|nr:hypothetical protein [Erysipelotrichaceae bacterium]
MTMKVQDDLKTDNLELRTDGDEALISEMLGVAIEELREIGAEREIWLVDDGKICQTYEQIYSYLKNRVLRRLDK